MHQTHDETHATNNGLCQPGTGRGANKARLVPTALKGPAQQGREPYPIILPHIAIGVSVAPHVPALSAVLAVAAPLPGAEYQPTLVLTPVTNAGKGQETGAHEQHSEEEEEGAAREPIAPKASPEQKRGCLVITTTRLRFPPHQWGIRHNGVLGTLGFSL